MKKILDEIGFLNDCGIDYPIKNELYCEALTDLEYAEINEENEEEVNEHIDYLFKQKCFDYVKIIDTYNTDLYYTNRYYFLCPSLECWNLHEDYLCKILDCDPDELQEKKQGQLTGYRYIYYVEY